MQASALPTNFTAPENAGPDEWCAAAKAYLSRLHEAQRAGLGADFPVEDWIAHLTRQTDIILRGLFERMVRDGTTALAAIGGYGRGELFPKSDIDLLIITGDGSDTAAIAAFVQQLWQLGLDIAQSVRSPAQCLDFARQDPDMLTSLLEARLLAGCPARLAAIDVCHPPLISRRAFLEIKLDEQRKRDANQPGKLEPNVKTGPGGLRDIQMIYWANRYCLAYDAAVPNDLSGLLTDAETAELIKSRRSLWQIRFALHLTTRQQKDRLSFEQQKLLARIFAYPDGANNMAIEQFMRRYYLSTLRVRRLNRLAIKLIDAAMRTQNEVISIDDDFELINQRLALKNPEALTHRPAIVWQIFLHLLNNPLIDSLSPQLGRQLRENRDRIFTVDTDRAAVHRTFLQILNHGGDIFRQVRRMHRYGILSRYLPDFAHVIGLMQYDLFHEYTVDQHTLRLIYFLDQFKSFQPDYPDAQNIMANLRHPAILYLAALFHDIGKGRGGDHSLIGEEIAASYLADNTAITPHDGELLKFLIKQHLILSTTAQKKDLSDPDVIAEFAAKIPDAEHLDYLYLLTLADISATNGTLWNSWRANLMHSLYRQTRNYLTAAAPSDEQQLAALKSRALEQLAEDPIGIGSLWQHLPREFFAGETPDAIAAKTRALLENPDGAIALHLQNYPPRLFISASTSPDILFARATHFMEKSGLAIMEARLYTDYSRKRAYQQYTLADNIQFSPALLKELQHIITGSIPPKPLGARLSGNALKHFSADTRISARPDHSGERTLMELTCKDRHGLLSLISRVFLEHRIHLAHAKIATFGERAEDAFYLTDSSGAPLTDAAAAALADDLKLHLASQT